MAEALSSTRDAHCERRPSHWFPNFWSGVHYHRGDDGIVSRLVPSQPQPSKHDHGARIHSVRACDIDYHLSHEGYLF